MIGSPKTKVQPQRAYEDVNTEPRQPLIPSETIPTMALITIKRYRDLSEAIVARSVLESNGIPAYLCDENFVRLVWHISGSLGGIRLQVESEDELEAFEVLDSPIPEVIHYGGQTPAYTQPRCPQCGSTEISFQGSSRKAALISLYAVGLPLPPGPESWHCANCQNQWQEPG